MEDGLECNCATLALFKQWTGLIIEGNEENYKKLATVYSTYPRIKTLNHFITQENIVPIFKSINVPLQFDLLSIDIDGNDYWVWQALLIKSGFPRLTPEAAYHPLAYGPYAPFEGPYSEI